MADPLLEATYRVRLQNRNLPEGMHDGLIRYLVYGLPPGSFLEAVLSNDLLEAVKRCDPVNEAHLADYVKFLYNHAPAQAWGTPERVWSWIESKARPRSPDAASAPTRS